MQTDDPKAIYRTRSEELREKIENHQKLVSEKKYESKSEFQHDYSVGMELLQQYTDLLGDISEFVDEGGCEDG